MFISRVLMLMSSSLAILGVSFMFIFDLQKALSAIGRVIFYTQVSWHQEIKI